MLQGYGKSIVGKMHIPCTVKTTAIQRQAMTLRNWTYFGNRGAITLSAEPGGQGATYYYFSPGCMSLDFNQTLTGNWKNWDVTNYTALQPTPSNYFNAYRLFYHKHMAMSLMMQPSDDFIGKIRVSIVKYAPMGTSVQAASVFPYWNEDLEGPMNPSYYKILWTKTYRLYNKDADISSRRIQMPFFFPFNRFYRYPGDTAPASANAWLANQQHSDFCFMTIEVQKRTGNWDAQLNPEQGTVFCDMKVFHSGHISA